jgi:NAD(P)-dependent dehydrogenase (short-subunit alcohol dehydrogenase family)
VTGDRGVVLVTGATGGIGRAVVRDLAGRGYAVLATDVAPAADDVRELGERVRYVSADVTERDQMRAAVAAAEELGTFAGCVANAGVLAEDFSSFVEAREATWSRTFAVNVLGVLNTFQAAAVALARVGGGRMAATASVAGVRAEPNLPAYSASKAAVISIVKSLALELGEAGITVNAVAPGPVRTEGQLRLAEERKQRSTGPAAVESPADRFDRHRSEGRPISRLATPEEVAGAFAWLLSDAAAYVTGQVLVIDGGGVLA